MADPRQKAAGVSGKKARHRVLARHAVRLYAILWMTLQNGTFKTHLTALVRHGPNPSVMTLNNAHAQGYRIQTYPVPRRHR